MTQKLVEQFQCPGCVVGSSTGCGKFKQSGYGSACESHTAGTVMNGHRTYLGLPRGFNKVGPVDFSLMAGSSNVRIFPASAVETLWNKFNVPVWAMEHEGHLLVRTLVPRLGMTFIDIIEEGTLDMVPNAINVSEFTDEID